MGEERTEGAQAPEYVSVGEAAKILGVHRNTVHHRIKAGRIRAHKVIEAEREVYRIERESLGVGRTRADVRTFDAQRPTEVEELVKLIAGPLEQVVRDRTEELGAVREQLGAERALRRVAEERAATLEEENRALREARESSTPTTATAEGVDAAPAPEDPQEVAQLPQEEPPEPVALAQASSVGPSVGETPAPPEPEEAEQERAAEQLDTEEVQGAEVTAPLHIFDRADDAATVEHERIVSAEPTSSRGSTSADAEPERRSFLRWLFGR